jgi:hypothetical protein
MISLWFINQEYPIGVRDPRWAMMHKDTQGWAMMHKDALQHCQACDNYQQTRNLIQSNKVDA